MNHPGRTCPHCGAAVSSPFCTSCGRSVETAPLFAPQDQQRTAPQAAVPPRTVAPRTAPQPVVPHLPVAQRPPGGTGARTLLLRAGIAFVVLIATGIAGVFGYEWWRDRPAMQALEAADAAVASVSRPLGEAASLEDVSAAAAAAPASAEKVSDALADLSDDETTLAERVRPVLQTQQAFLESLVPFEGLNDESLAVWGTTLPSVQESLTELVVARRSLGAYDEGAADRVRDPGNALDHAVEVVGSSAAESLRVQLDELLVELTKVRTTREAAVLGERADPLADAAAAAEAGQQGTDLDVLTSLGDALGAIAALDGMDPETLQRWGPARTELTAATAELGVSSEDAAESMSTWVSQAQKKMDTWRAEYDRAESVRSSATSQLDTYAASVRRTLRQYDRARDATADALETAELDAYSSSYDVEYAMEEGVLTRRDLLDDLQSLSVPPALVSTHGGLEAVLGSGVEAMRTGEQAVEDWNLCYLDCAETYRDTSGWQAFSTRSGEISGEFDRALKAWNTALNQALSQANAVPLPAMPKV